MLTLAITAPPHANASLTCCHFDPLVLFSAASAVSWWLHLSSLTWSSLPRPLFHADRLSVSVSLLSLLFLAFFVSLFVCFIFVFIRFLVLLVGHIFFASQFLLHIQVLTLTLVTVSVQKINLLIKEHEP